LLQGYLRHLEIKDNLFHTFKAINQPIEPIVKITYILADTVIKNTSSSNILLLPDFILFTIDISNPVNANGEPIIERKIMNPAVLNVPPPMLKKIGPRM